MTKTINQNGKGKPVLPHNIDVEQALLGALLSNSRVFDVVADLLEPEHFYDPNHADIYRVIKSKVSAGQSANPVSLRGFADSHDGLKPLGGVKYLGILVSSVVTVVNSADYANTIRALWMRRELIRLSGEISDRAKEEIDDDKAELRLEEAQEALGSLTLTQSEKTLYSMARATEEAIQAMCEATKRGGGLAGLTTGLTELDKLTSGFAPGRLYVIAARPGMGKSALSLGMAEAMAVTGAPVCIFSMEMDAQELSRRSMGSRSGVSVHRQSSGLTDPEWQKIFPIEKGVKDLPIWIDEQPRLKVNVLILRARRYVRQYKIKAIFIDYLGLMAPTDPRANRVHQIEEITGALKALAKELKIPVILLAQLNRGVELREDKRPTLADLRDSGAIEQDADVVMFIYRAEYYLSRETDEQKSGESQKAYNERVAATANALDASKGKADIIVAKNRHGQCGTAVVGFNGPKTTFHNL